MSTPAYLNSPPSPFRFIDLKEDQHLQFYLLQNQAASSSLSSPILFNMPQDQFQNNQHKSEYNYMLHGGPSNCYQGIPSSSSAQQLIRDSEGGHEFSAYKLEDKCGNKRDRHDQPAKWMSSTMMVNIQEKITQNSNDQRQNNITTNTSFIRVCSDCNTTKTPLWRSGPQGPKSLCNACGIRQRKARRALAAAANGAALAAENATVRTKVHIKDKKPRTTLNRKPFKHPAASNPQQNGDHKVSFKDFALSLSKNSALPQETFPEDVEEAAVLLMALSCGLLHS